MRLKIVLGSRLSGLRDDASIRCHQPREVCTGLGTEPDELSGVRLGGRTSSLAYDTTGEAGQAPSSDAMEGNLPPAAGSVRAVAGELAVEDGRGVVADYRLGDRQKKKYPSVGESLRDSQLSVWEAQYCLGKLLPAGRLSFQLQPLLRRIPVSVAAEVFELVRDFGQITSPDFMFDVGRRKIGHLVQ